MSTLVEGRRVADHESIERGGDYYVSYSDDGGIANVVFATPGYLDFHGELVLNVITGSAAPTERVCWQVSENPDGRVTADPSFLVMWRERGIDRRFHCFLRAGVFEVLDDSTGAELPD